MSLKVEKTPTLDEFAEQRQRKSTESAADVKEEKRENPENFSGPSGAYPYPYPYPPYAYPYPPYPAQAQGGAPMAPGFYNAAGGDGYQMPPIVQPVAFVPYVTQEQPLMQYSPVIEEPKKAQPLQAQPVQPVQSNPKSRKN